MENQFNFEYPAKSDKEVLPEVEEAVKSYHWMGALSDHRNFDVWYAFRDFKHVPVGTYNPFRAELLKKL
jgi:hypothetical protein